MNPPAEDAYGRTRGQCEEMHSRALVPVFRPIGQRLGSGHCVSQSGKEVSSFSKHWIGGLVPGTRNTHAQKCLVSDPNRYIVKMEVFGCPPASERATAQPHSDLSQPAMIRYRGCVQCKLTTSLSTGISILRANLVRSDAHSCCPRHSCEGAGTSGFEEGTTCLRTSSAKQRKS